MKAKLFYPSVRVRRSRQTRLTRFMLPLLLICLALTLASSSALAHGIGYYQIRGAKIDPYTIHVWVAPGMLRTGDVHIDTAVFDDAGKPALATFVQVAFIPLDGVAPRLQAIAGLPDLEYPHARGATFRLETAGQYRLEVAVSDTHGISGTTSVDVEVVTMGWAVKAAILALAFMTAATGVWLLIQTRAFWLRTTPNRISKLQRLQIRGPGMESYVKNEIKRYGRGESYSMNVENLGTYRERASRLLDQLNGRFHAPALWIYMLVIVAHWLEHVLQIYQIYGLGWAPENAGGILGVFYPSLVESETLHFVYDFIQWAGILLFYRGFQGRARTWWQIALVGQTWHYIEHVLLMGQYLTGYYLFGAPHQISILQLWFPRAELHFAYNLICFIPMVVAVHLYLQPKLEMMAAIKAASAPVPEGVSSETA